MSLFKNILNSDESLFRDTVALDYDYLPKILPYRVNEQRQFAFAIKPLFNERSGRNLFVYGAPGIGKTAAMKYVIRELEIETDEIIPLFVNCWKCTTAYKVMIELCTQLGIRFVQNLKTTELFERLKKVVNEKSAVFVFDEVDKLENFDVLYMILEDVYRKCLFLITNYKEKVQELDERIMSRLNPEHIEFLPYNASETAGILLDRREYSFVPGVWNDGAFERVVKETVLRKDIRQGLFFMREAGTIAEERASRSIQLEHVERAVEKRPQLHSTDGLDDELRKILQIVKKKRNQRMGELFQLYLAEGGELSYRSFQRKIEKLEKGKFVVTQRHTAGEGNTTLVSVYGEKKITDF